MTISCWDSFTANDWERYSRLFAYVVSVLATFFSILTWAFPKEWKTDPSHSAGVGVWSLVLALFIVFQETPLCNCGPGAAVKVFVDDTLYFKKPVVPGVIYMLASILCFVWLTPVIGTGIFLLLLAILKFFAQCQVSQDASDRTRYQNQA